MVASTPAEHRACGGPSGGRGTGAQPQILALAAAPLLRRRRPRQRPAAARHVRLGGPRSARPRHPVDPPARHGAPVGQGPAPGPVLRPAPGRGHAAAADPDPDGHRRRPVAFTSGGPSFPLFFFVCFFLFFSSDSVRNSEESPMVFIKLGISDNKRHTLELGLANTKFMFFKAIAEGPHVFRVSARGPRNVNG